MKWTAPIIIVAVLVAGGYHIIFKRFAGSFVLLNEGLAEEIIMDKFKITSEAFSDGGEIPAKYTCDGGNINPPLEIGNVPKSAKSLAIAVEDPDAPSGTWDHWIKWNVPASTSVIMEGQDPQGASGKGSGGNTKYQGPCPPEGEHRYIFKVFALDTLLSLKSGSSKKDLEEAMEGHIIGKAEIMGRYKRNK